MTGPLRRRRLVGTAVFVGLGLIIIFLRLMPLSPGRPGLPGSDLMLCLTCAWVLRRPDQLPAPVIVALFLVADFLLGRPFGLWTLFVLAGTELLRPRALRWADQAFLFEWLRVSGLMGLMMIGYRLMMTVFLLPVPALAPVLLGWLATVAAYPLVVLAVRLMGVRRLSPAELEMTVH
ncbi:MAG: rod shape-determining protein MreD [Paracoccus sp. (in: a-proteobacteria)]|nr:rod shape-determining protein MreD [Paracoccus sp. (in: a-proteobacteria)]